MALKVSVVSVSLDDSLKTLLLASKHLSVVLTTYRHHWPVYDKRPGCRTFTKVPSSLTHRIADAITLSQNEL